MPTGLRHHQCLFLLQLSLLPLLLVATDRISTTSCGQIPVTTRLLATEFLRAGDAALAVLQRFLLLLDILQNQP